MPEPKTPPDYNVSNELMNRLDRRDTRRPLNAAGGGGTSGGMDPWQQTVETRLTELRTDTRQLTKDVSGLVATVAELPRKGYIVAVVLTGTAVLGAITTFAPLIQKILGIAQTH